jgi:hypothetical protein
MRVPRAQEQIFAMDMVSRQQWALDAVAAVTRASAEIIATGLSSKSGLWFYPKARNCKH